MQPILTFDRTVVAVDVDGDAHLMVELAAPPAPPVDRAPVDVAVVIDRSGSMDGEPLGAVTRAVEHLFRIAGPDDRVAVVAFDDEVTLVLPLAHHEPRAAGRLVRSIESGGSTNLSGGWLKAAEVLAADGRPDAIRRVVLLTDGCANVGVVEPERLTAMTAGGTARGITTSCIGFGDGHDETLLAALADAGGGNDAWCAGPDQAATVFVTEFTGLQQIVAQNLTVELRPDPAAVRSLHVLHEYPLTPLDDGAVQIALGDAYGDERRRVVARFELAAPGRTGEVPIGEVVIRWASVGADVRLHTVTLPVSLEAGPDADTAPLDTEVVEEITLQRAAEERRAARLLAESGDYDLASKHLRNAAGILAAVDASAADVTELLLEADRLDDGRWDAMAAKRLHAINRSVARKRRVRFEDTEPGHP